MNAITCALNCRSQAHTHTQSLKENENKNEFHDKQKKTVLYALSISICKLQQATTEIASHTRNYARDQSSVNILETNACDSKITFWRW